MISKPIMQNSLRLAIILLQNYLFIVNKCDRASLMQCVSLDFRNRFGIPHTTMFNMYYNGIKHMLRDGRAGIPNLSPIQIHFNLPKYCIHQCITQWCYTSLQKKVNMVWHCPVKLATHPLVFPKITNLTDMVVL